MIRLIVKIGGAFQKRKTLLSVFSLNAANNRLQETVWRLKIVNNK